MHPAETGAPTGTDLSTLQDGHTSITPLEVDRDTDGATRA
jgi:hypothetical protein